MKKWIALAVLGLALVWWLWPRHLPHVGQGYAELDLSVYDDPARDGEQLEWLA